MSLRIADVSAFVAGPLVHPSGRWAPPAAVPSTSGPEEMALLLADVSGFTALTTALSADGAAGAEQVGGALDEMFGSILEEVAAHGGIPVASAGDSLLAMWPACLHGDLRAGVEAASACASAIEARFASPKVVGGIPLGVHVSQSAGLVEAMHVGEIGRHFLLTGPAVVAVGGGVLTDHALARMADSLRDAVATPARGDDPESLARYVPRAVAQRIAAGHGEWLADLRRVSVVFAGLPGLAVAPLEQWHDVIGMVHDVTDGLEGEVHHVMVDDKGAAAISVFGLPPLLHEDDPRRAVLAATRMHRALQGSGIDARIGVATGRVFSGPVGTSAWRRYTVIGEAVNLAARLHAVTDAIACDSATVAACPEAGFDARDAVRLKGFDSAVGVWSPSGTVSEAARSARDVRLRGRTAERAVLDDSVARARAGLGGAVIVEAEAGLGKSTLLAELASDLRAGGVNPLVVAGDAIETGVPFHAWRDLALEAIATPKADPSARRDLVVRAAEARLAGNVPAVLIAEDTHWFDSASWAVLSALRATLPSLLVITATRPQPMVHPDEARLRAHAATEILPLGALERDDVEALVADVLDTTGVQPSLVEALSRRGEGNPYFVKEVARAFMAAGAVTVVDGVARFAAGAEHTLDDLVPAGLDGIVVARLDRLTPTEQLTAKIAAVIGRAFTLRAVAQVYPVDRDRDRVAAAVESLEEAAITERQPDPGAYSFAHAITRDVAYSLLSTEQRRRVHADVADWLEQRHADELDRVAAVLAHHRDVAGDVLAARRLYERAGDHALALGAYREASTAYERYLTLVPDDEQRAEYERLADRLGRAHLGLGDLRNAYDDIGVALERAGFAVNGSTPRLVLRLARELVVHLAYQIGLGRRARQRDRRDERLVLPPYYLLCSSYTTVKIPGPAPYVVFRAANLAERSGHPIDIAESYAYLAIAASTTPLKPLARRYVARSRAAVERADPAERMLADGLATYGLAMSSVWLGEPHTALPASIETHDKLMAAGERRRAADATCMGGFAALWCGDFAATEAVASTLWADSALDENEQMQAYSAIARVLTALATGRDDDARRTVTALLSLDDSRVADQELAFRLAASALVRHLDGEDVGADCERIADLMAADRMLTVPGRWQVYGILATIGLDRVRSLGRRDPWLPTALRGLRRYRRVLPIAAPACDRLHAVDAWARGRRRRAARLLVRAERSAVALGMRHQEALVHLTAGDLRVADGDGEGAVAALTSALGMLVAIGSHGDARRAEGLLAQVMSAAT